MIPKNIAQRIIEEADIVKVVGQSVQLKRKGSNYTGLCPFHTEKTPSFMVSPAKGIYKCFGCGQGGDAVKFVMQTQNISFPEALKLLAKDLNIEIEEREATEEEKFENQRRENLIQFYEFARDYYRMQLTGKALDYAQSRMKPESIKSFDIGYAPAAGRALADHARMQGYKEEFLLTTGLIRQNDKDGHLYDFFRDRLVFPIYDHNNRLISFTGRVLPGADAKQSKYINLAESETYHKSKVLYGLNMAKNAIGKSETAIIVEGNTDVIRLHELDQPVTVAPMGTAFTHEQLLLLKRYAKKLVLLYDGDNAGKKASIKNAKLAVEHGFAVYVALLEEGKDPADAFTDEADLESFLKNKRMDFIQWHAANLIIKSAEDPHLKNEATKEMAVLLANYETTLREEYINSISGNGKFNAETLRDEIKAMTKEAAEPESNKKQNLPEAVDVNEYYRWGFYEHNNSYYFRAKGDKPEHCSNFVMRPLFHVNSIYDSKRIFELENVHNYKVVVNLDMQEMTSLQAFQRNVEGKGNFLFWGTPAQFNRLKLKLYEETRTCTEISILGWQKEGFWAWSNGIITEEGFKQIDDYGVVEFDDKHYFIPAFSRIYINDKSIFIDERKFRFKTKNISLMHWSQELIKVFGDNAKISLMFWVAATFRDHLFHIFGNFPLLNLFGPRGSGKSELAKQLMTLYGIPQNALNIHNATKASLSQLLQNFSNSLAWIDEYKNSLDFVMIETLKSVYDAVGRNRMNMDKGKKKETTEVNSAVILSGQEMPTADNALFTRVIFLQFDKTEFTSDQKNNIDQLKSLGKDGLSHLTVELLKHRQYFTSEFYSIYSDTLADFNKEFEDNPIEGRLLSNMVTIVAAWRTIARKIEFPFSYPEIFKISLKSLKTHNSHVGSSDEVGIFWDVFESLYDTETLIEGWHFKIEHTKILEFTNGKKKDFEGKRILKFKYTTVYKMYSEQARRQGLKPLPSDTLKYYLQNHKFYIGVQRACMFAAKLIDPKTHEYKNHRMNTTAFCFDYERLEKMGINLEREAEENDYTPPVPLNGHAKNTDYSMEPKTAESTELPF
jgi:DNA primase catalytic core